MRDKAGSHLNAQNEYFLLKEFVVEEEMHKEYCVIKTESMTK